MFKSDITALRSALSSRKRSLEELRRPHESMWSEIAANFEPQFGRALKGYSDNQDSDSAPLNDQEIINSHPRLALSRLGAGMHGGITSPTSQWFRLSIDDPKIAERQDVKEWLDDVTREMAATFSRSNLYTTLHQTYLHLLFGTACFLVINDEQTDIHTILLDEGSYFIATDRKGVANTLLRQFAMSVSQIIEEFGMEAINKDQILLSDYNAKRLEKQHIINQYIAPNDSSLPEISPNDIDKKRPYVSLYWRDGSPTDSMLAIRSYGWNPIIAPRWHTIGSAVYGFGPGHYALSDAKELQKLESDRLKAIAKLVEPPVTAPEDMRDEPINSYPGGVTYRRDSGLNAQAHASISPLYEVRPDISALSALIQEIEQRIDKNFFVDLFAMMLNMNQRPKQMTAREVNELSQEKMALLGPVLTRLNTDLLDPLIEATYKILADSNRLLPAPEAIANKALTIRYISILHTEQQSTSRLGSMIRLADFIAIYAGINPSCVDKIDADQAIDEAANVLATPARILRTDKDVLLLRQQRAQAQQDAIRAEQLKSAPGLAQATKTLSETTNPPGSALDFLSQAMQQNLQQQ